MRTLVDMKITVSRKKLLDVLSENYDKHCNEYESAVVRYRTHAITQLEGRLTDLKDPTTWRGIKPRKFLDFSPDAPVSYADVYQEVIDMLEMCEDSKLTISAHQFRCWVKDDWEWKPEFTRMSNAY